MQFQPTASELYLFDEMDDRERLQYFLSRTIETEELWAIADAEGWILVEEDNQIRLRLWPYKQLAEKFGVANEHVYPDATSLDHFIHTLLVHMANENMELELIPTPACRGVRISATRLYEQYSSLLEAGDYYLEG